MDNIAGIGSFGIPSPGCLNMMTIKMVKDKDSDGDNVLSVKELNVSEDVFTKINANGDGNAEREETLSFSL